jgi:hypothetical protein
LILTINHLSAIARSATADQPPVRHSAQRDGGSTFSETDTFIVLFASVLRVTRLFRALNSGQTPTMFDQPTTANAEILCAQFS